MLGDTEVEGHASSGASNQDGLGSTGTGDRRIRQPDDLLPRYEAQMGRKCTASSPRWCWPRRRRLCHRHPAAATRTWTLPDNHRRAYKKAMSTSSEGPRTSHLPACREPLVMLFVKEGSPHLVSHCARSAAYRCQPQGPHPSRTARVSPRPSRRTLDGRSSLPGPGAVRPGAEPWVGPCSPWTSSAWWPEGQTASPLLGGDGIVAAHGSRDSKPPPASTEVRGGRTVGGRVMPVNIKFRPHRRTSDTCYAP